MRLATLFFLVSAFGFAQSWSGYLVDSGCYKSDQANHNVDPSTVERDMNMEWRQCSPNAKTKDFALVLPDWSSLNLDPAGNTKAAEIVRNSAKKMPIAVTVSGERTAGTVKVISIARTSIAKTGQ